MNRFASRVTRTLAARVSKSPDQFVASLRCAAFLRHRWGVKSCVVVQSFCEMFIDPFIFPDLSHTFLMVWPIFFWPNLLVVHYGSCLSMATSRWLHFHVGQRFSIQRCIAEPQPNGRGSGVFSPVFCTKSCRARHTEALHATWRRSCSAHHFWRFFCVRVRVGSLRAVLAFAKTHGSHLKRGHTRSQTSCCPALLVWFP